MHAVAPHSSVAVGHHVHHIIAAAVVESRRNIVLVVPTTTTTTTTTVTETTAATAVAMDAWRSHRVRSLRRCRSEPLALDVPVMVRQDVVVAGARHRHLVVKTCPSVVSFSALEKQKIPDGYTLLQVHCNTMCKCIHIIFYVVCRVVLSEPRNVTVYINNARTRNAYKYIICD